MRSLRGAPPVLLLLLTLLLAAGHGAVITGVSAAARHRAGRPGPTAPTGLAAPAPAAAGGLEPGGGSAGKRGVAGAGGLCWGNRTGAGGLR